VRKLTIFNTISLDGYFADPQGDMSWAKPQAEDAEHAAFVAENAKGGGMLLFGRVTYEMMAAFWPTPMAAQVMPDVAERMNSLPKIVFSATLDKASWHNTTLIKGDVATEVRKLKGAAGPAMTVLGSGSIVAQLAQARLIDEYQVMIAPVILGAGWTLFEGVKDRLALTLTRSRAFGNGSVFLSYAPA
jgi:dihydrofolate reductase